MFDNSGSKVKELAVIFFTVYVVLLAILGIVAMIANFLIGLLVFGAGVLSAYIMAITMSALGEAAESSEEAKRASEAVLKMLRDEREEKEREARKAEEEKKKQEEREKFEAMANTARNLVVDESKSSTDNLMTLLHSFVVQAAMCDKVTKIRELWEEYAFEVNPLTEEIRGKINSTASVARLYGDSPSTAKRLVEEITAIVQSV